ncbi:hypothetical protein [Salipiger marinus]|uniref:hypothetical protein n=1 Tax=Salipiger marinus TaxID=555512 RepID=UPI00104200F6|nr:hypothetical protein [Salipiger marinus]
MINQQTFDRAEEILEALHEQEGLSVALANVLSSLDLEPDQEQVLLALVTAQDRCRSRAGVAANQIARSGAVDRSP